ncbi:anaerobic sulfatase maturase [candidate division KSB1 bacterium]|nr:anaerobic sulfatase maturase [candidate division KSB1 bacterium]
MANPIINTQRNYSVLIKPAGPDCNLNCSYCFYLCKSSLFPETKRHRMTIEVLEELTRQLMQNGGMHPSFLWQGGEPTLMGLDFFRQAIELQKKYGRSGQSVSNSLQTNGLLIDEGWAKFLHDYQFLIGLSLDGPQALHDTYRRSPGGQGSYKFVMRAAELFNTHQVEFNILCLINDVNVRDAEKLFRYYTDNGFRYLQFIPAIELDAHGKVAPFCPDPEMYGRFLCDLFDAWYNDGQPEIYIRTFEDILHIYYGLPSPGCIFREICGDYVVVEHTGGVYSCDFFVDPEHHLGDISEDGLIPLFDCARQKDFGCSKADLPNECHACEFLRYCYGGCLKERVFRCGGNTVSSNYFCSAYKTFFAYTDSRFKQLAEFVKRRNEEQRQRERRLAILKRWRKLNPGKEPGRNESCPCGSGKKYKKCCQTEFNKLA